MDTKALFDYIDNEWTTSGIPALMEFIKVPSLSPGYDPDWATNGNLKKALDLMKVRVMRNCTLRLFGNAVTTSALWTSLSLLKPCQFFRHGPKSRLCPA
jgi:hypothetical protein